ncbi:MAG: AbrB/MazE/SpoVT family DNA-binding domain-containing protein [Ruminococcus sp.]|nr:AbrB/MazE/SpoVT family DNA-binding domain-containing protein [Ruminococcus sp.]
MIVKHKKLTSKAGITIPKDMRLSSGLTEGMAVDLTETAEGILISKHRPTCCYCGSEVDVKSIKGRDTCRKCADQIVEEVSNSYESC